MASENNKRIAKNTLLLYFRMLITMLVSLYTSRIVLNALGVIDFGIYNVVGGVVSMFSVLSGSLSSAISRFITFELGRSNFERLKMIFSTAVTILVIFAIFIIILAETVGIWFLNHKMNIPLERMSAANWVFQLSILTFIVNLISVPYNASIIAHERMSAFAYISILEVVGKLIIAYLISISPIDKLIFYAILICLMAFVIRMVYGLYCKKYFYECSFQFFWNPQLLRQMFSFAGWSFIGISAGIFRNHGVNILLNMYYTPIVNAAYGIASQINNAVTSFSNNFILAVKPQIVMSYSRNELQRSFELVMNSARFGYFLMFIISIPIIFEIEFLLKIWLGNFPEFTIIFTRMTLILSLLEVVSLPLISLQQATGKIKDYQIVVGFIHMLNFPISWIFIWLGFLPYVVYLIAIILCVLSLYARIIMLKRVVNISLYDFNREVIFRISRMSILAVIILFYVNHSVCLQPFMGILFSFFVSVLCVFWVGLKKQERKIIISKIVNKL